MLSKKRTTNIRFHIKTNNLLIGLIFIFLVINVLLVGVYWNISTNKKVNNFPELETLQKKDMQMNEIQSFFEDIAKNKGAVYAYELLKVAPLPSSIDVHLLGHTVGDELYKQKGISGMLLCSHDFRNACSHTIVIGEMLTNGEKALKNIHEVCQKAPGGSGAYDMCYHGLGHGVFAYTDYNLEKAVEICKMTQDYKVSGREYGECVGGIIMELTGGGDHDRELWMRQKKIYTSQDNPLSPCNTNIIPDEVKSFCYVYLTPHLFEITGARPGKPSDEALEKSFKFCNQIPLEQQNNRGICYRGFGKEFVVLAKDRDIRKIDSMTKLQMEQIIHWCKLAKNNEGEMGCLLGAMGSLYWGGENPVEPVIKFCGLLTSSFQNECLEKLISTVGAYTKNKDDYLDFCRLLPESSVKSCFDQKGYE